MTTICRKLVRIDFEISLPCESMLNWNNVPGNQGSESSNKELDWIRNEESNERYLRVRDVSASAFVGNLDNLEDTPIDI